jgi:hypothetical protein
MSNPKKCGKNKQRVFLDVFSPSENDSRVHLPIKNLFHTLENLRTFAVRHCSSFSHFGKNQPTVMDCNSGTPLGQTHALLDITYTSFINVPLVYRPRKSTPPAREPHELDPASPTQYVGTFACKVRYDVQCWTRKIDNFATALSRFFGDKWMPDSFSGRPKTSKSGLCGLFPRYLHLERFLGLKNIFLYAICGVSLY